MKDTLFQTQISKFWFRYFLAGIGLLPCSSLAENNERLFGAAINVLNHANRLSIEKKVEYCGYLFQDLAGNVFTSQPIKGLLLSCSADHLNKNLNVVASWHTHGSYNSAIDSETPSSYDLIDDLVHNQLGFVSTPSGRVWFLNPFTGKATVLCGAGCVFADPFFQFSYSDPNKKVYILEELLEREKARRQ